MALLPSGPTALGTTLASVRLGYSGATIYIRETQRAPKEFIFTRTFTLVGANGRRRVLHLSEGSGRAHNWSFNLYDANDGRIGRDNPFLLVGETDCIEFDPVFVTARHCAKRPPCVGGARPAGLAYLGRFDFMNGYDPPKGAFRTAFRYLPANDAMEGSICQTQGPVSRR